jgi:succinoglycan biosynthesis protein ExoA
MSHSAAASSANQSARPVHDIPFVSVIMPVRNEEACLGRLLGQLLAQDYDPERYEILVVDGVSTDRTREVVKSLAATNRNLRLLDNQRRWSSAARNIGMREARGDLIVIVDGHCELPRSDYFRIMAAAFERSEADCLGRPQPLQVAEPAPLERAIGLARASRIGHHPASYIYSAQERQVPAQSVAVAYRRAVFEHVGMFDETFDACEDVELNHRIDRAGLRCLLVPELAVFYRPRGTLRALFGQLVRYGRGRVRLMFKHPETTSVGTFLPASLVLGIIAGLPLCFLSIWLAAFYLGTLVIYFATVVVASVILAIRARSSGLLLWLPIVFATIHIACGWGVLSELLLSGLLFRGRLSPRNSLQLESPGSLPPTRQRN